MDVVTEDPELAREMAQLLYKKLQRARQELEEKTSEGLLVDSSNLREHNESLREELANLRLQLDLAIENSDQKTVQIDHENFVVASDTSDETLGHIDEQQMHDIQIMAEKCHNYKEKYKKATMKKAELEERLSTLHKAYQLMSQNESKTVENVAELQDQMALLEPPLDSGVTFDPLKFLSSREGNSRFPNSESIAPFLVNKPLNKVPRSIHAKFERLVLILRSHEVVWNDDLNLAVVLAPSFSYGPGNRTDKGTWKCSDVKHRLGNLQPSSAVEVIYEVNGRCFYYGTYRCIQSSPVSAASAAKLGEQVWRNILSGTVRSRDYVAPFVARFVEAMLEGGALTVECYGMERIDINYDLQKALVAFSWA